MNKKTNIISKSCYCLLDEKGEIITANVDRSTLSYMASVAKKYQRKYVIKKCIINLT